MNKKMVGPTLFIILGNLFFLPFFNSNKIQIDILIQLNMYIIIAQSYSIKKTLNYCPTCPLNQWLGC